MGGNNLSDGCFNAFVNPFGFFYPGARAGIDMQSDLTGINARKEVGADYRQKCKAGRIEAEEDTEGQNRMRKSLLQDMLIVFTGCFEGSVDNFIDG